MGLDAAITGAVNAAINAVGDLAVDVTIVNVSASAYNATTGAVTDTAAETAIKGVLGDYSAHEIASGIAQTQDRKLFIRQSDLSFTLKLKDRVKIGTAVYQIVPPLREDPAHASWIVQLRGSSS